MTQPLDQLSSDGDDDNDLTIMTPPPKRSPYFKIKPNRRAKKRRVNPNTIGLPSLAVTDVKPTIPNANASALHAHRPLPALKNLNVRSKDDNAASAMIFKQLINHDDSVFGPVKVKRHTRPQDKTVGKTHFEDMFAGQFGVSRRHLRSLSHIEDEEGPEETVQQSNHLLIGQSKPQDQGPSIHFPKEGGEAEQPEVHYGRQTKLYITDAGCDIPMPRSSPESRSSVKVSFEPNLPPMAAEHPTRVWNLMLHSLAPELQPIVKWEYDQDHGGDQTWTAHLTLILPPTHPSLTNHPLYYVLPKNRYSSHYIKAIEALGGVRTWSGQPRKLKTDAQNSALLQCITDKAEALAWVHTPIMAPVPELENESLEEGKHSERERIDKEGQDNERPVKEGLGKEAREMKPVLKESPTQTNLDQDEPLETANAFPCGTARSRPFMDGVDWIQQLSKFCHISGLPPPRYSQRVERGASTFFYGLVTVEDEQFEAGVPHVSLKSARQEVAEQVYIGHFGQDPVEL